MLTLVTVWDVFIMMDVEKVIRFLVRFYLYDVQDQDKSASKTEETVRKLRKCVWTNAKLPLEW